MDEKELLAEAERLLVEATRKHFTILQGEDLNDKFYGYTLYSCDDATSVSPVANRLSHFSLAKDDPSYSYYRYCASEWSLWDDHGLFDEVNSLLSELMEDEDDDEDDDEDEDRFIELRDEVFSMFLRVLVKLKDEGLFANMGIDSFVAVWISDSDSAIMSKSAKMLNDSKVFKEYEKEFC